MVEYSAYHLQGAAPRVVVMYEDSTVVGNEARFDTETQRMVVIGNVVLAAGNRYPLHLQQVEISFLSSPPSVNPKQ